MSSIKPYIAHQNISIRVSAPARLHLGFLDLNGHSGRKFGSIGLAIETYRTIIEAQLVNTTSIHSTPTASTEIISKVERIIDLFYGSLGQHIPLAQRGINLSLIKLIPEHAGLGSGTQLALTIGTALCRLHGISTSTHEIAAHLGRGTRSGIGIATFDHGGFIVDGGLSHLSQTPPLLVRYDFPENWCVVLIMDHSHQGVHGVQELATFKELSTFPLNHSQAICHLTIMKLLPALVEHNIEQFGQAITAIQTLIGNHFASAQGGCYTSPHVARLLNYAQRLGHTGIAQSSWGPTGAIFVNGDHAAKQLISTLHQYVSTQLTAPSELTFSIALPNQQGANMEIINL